MKHLLLVFFILTLFFLTNVKDANAGCLTIGKSTTVYTLPFTLNKGCLGSPTVYTLPFSTEYGTYYTLPATFSYYYGITTVCTDCTGSTYCNAHCQGLGYGYGCINTYYCGNCGCAARACSCTSCYSAWSMMCGAY